ncbi:MAG: translesion error-prone DNA polymerase V autoproteolytic subunit [Gammaproteobacteria bacterium]|nr:translesion error-prone DNA polymerase V autoproteolytic subunit [Gammaproteobacteria bacterium]
MVRGGKRRGAGRPKGSGKFSESTKAIRVPESMVNRILEYAYAGGFKLPLYENKVSAGSPTPVDDHIEDMIDLGKYLIPNPSSTFFIRVIGYSMINAGIQPDDMLIVDRDIEAKHNKIIIASINGELTVKRLYNKAGQIRLMPENDEFNPIDIESEENLHILGVVTNIIHTV